MMMMMMVSDSFEINHCANTLTGWLHCTNDVCCWQQAQPFLLHQTTLSLSFCFLFFWGGGPGLPSLLLKMIFHSQLIL